MKIFVVDKYVVLTVLIMLLVAFVLIPLSMPEGKTVMSEGGQTLPIYSVETEKKTVAVTFNAAWDADDTDAVLEALQEQDCHCTFFAVGTWLKAHPDAAQKIREAGHELASHSYGHGHFASMTKAEMETDLDQCDALLQTVTGTQSKLFRAPYGEYNETLVTLCEETGRYIIQWDIDSLDYKGLSAAEMEARILPRLHNGAIILFHTGTEQTASALPSLLEKIREAGYSFTTVGDLIYKDNYVIDHTGRQYAKT